jgi:hypothetical protein
LYHDAPFVVVVHNTDPDPRFIYANKAAQACFKYSWDEFKGLPSRLSAEAPTSAERQRLLDAVTRDGFIFNYRGVRIRSPVGAPGSRMKSCGSSSTITGSCGAKPRWRDV